METPFPSSNENPRQLTSVPVSVSESHKGLMDRSAAAGIPAMPLWGVLPLRRIIPQDLHSLLDYKGALMVAGAGLLACSTGRIAGLALGASGLGVSLLTDYRLSLKKIIPIEVHEVIDYVWSLGVIAAPFVLGYSRRNRVSTWMQVFAGVGTILGSLFTDYRAQRGVKWSRGSVTDLGPVGA